MKRILIVSILIFGVQGLTTTKYEQQVAGMQTHFKDLEKMESWDRILRLFEHNLSEEDLQFLKKATANQVFPKVTLIENGVLIGDGLQKLSIAIDPIDRSQVVINGHPWTFKYDKALQAQLSDLEERISRKSSVSGLMSLFVSEAHAIVSHLLVGTAGYFIGRWDEGRRHHHHHVHRPHYVQSPTHYYRPVEPRHYSIAEFNGSDIERMYCSNNQVFIISSGRHYYVPHSHSHFRMSLRLGNRSSMRASYQSTY